MTKRRIWPWPGPGPCGVRVLPPSAWESAARGSRSDWPGWPVQHEVHRAVDVDVVGDVVLDELEIRVARQMRDVADVAGEQVVDADDGIPAIEQRLGQVRSDEAAAPVMTTRVFMVVTDEGSRLRSNSVGVLWRNLSAP